MKEFQEKLVQVIIPVFENAIEKRKEYYTVNPRPAKENVESIINSCSLTNGAISGISGMLPGMAGLIAIVPELKATVENQIIMIYDIGVAHGKEEHMSKELVLSLAMQSGIGSVGINALARQGEKVLIKKASVKVFQQLAKTMGVKISASVVKSAVAKFVPVLGGVAIGVWVKYTTAEMGENSSVILAQDIQIQETENLTEFDQDETEKLEFLENKVIVLMNLMKADGESKEKEKEFITQIIDNIDFNFFKKVKLKADLMLSSPTEVDFEILASGTKSDKDALLIDMIALAKRDSELHAKEFEYIMQVCEKMNVDTKFVINELSANFNALKYYLRNKSTEAQGIIHCVFNGGNSKAQFYGNNRVFIFDRDNNVKAKGEYSLGGRKIRLDNGQEFQSNTVLDNLNAIVTT